MQENGPHLPPSCGTQGGVWFLQEGLFLIETPWWVWGSLSNKSIIDGGMFLLAISDLPNKRTACTKKSPVRANNNNICAAPPLLRSAVADGEHVRAEAAHRASAGAQGCPQAGTASPLLIIISQDWHVLPVLPVAAEAESVKQV